ncbi:hypothetical protein GOP47_0001273 [Adiantum capillus-veneris]|uniref:Pentatricopeptide repeat-containing protein n=1 Tax=Adiantum capillus-veneris TaxID=13818 RepID=A0A9D4ZRB9_ADICA|nr:hypothetical protein GOP47_0001273 [Adiantum capillus-veneris]
MALPSVEGRRLSGSSLDDVAQALHRCRKEKNRPLALHIHAFLCDSGLESQRSLGNYLVQLLVEIGSMEIAQQVFNKLVYRNECSWDSLITGYIKCGMAQNALSLYHEMMKDGSLHPSTDAYVALLQGCAKRKDLQCGHEIHSRLGMLETNLFVGSTLVSMYGKCGVLDKAQQTFDKIHNHNVVSWTALIAGYVEHGHCERALELFGKMQEAGVSPNAVTFVCILKACGGLGASYMGQEIHAEVESKGLLRTNVFIGSAVVDMYGNLGALGKAQDVFDKLPIRNSVSWNALISGYSESGYDRKVLKCFERMLYEGPLPNAVTFACVLKACANTGAVDKGRRIHAEVERMGFLSKEAFVGSSLINMYAKSGFLVRAQQVFDMLPTKDVVAWTALISGYAEGEHGEEALECFKKLQLKGLSPNAVTYTSSLKACGNIGALEKGEEIHAEIERRGLLEEGLVGSTLVDTYSRCGSLAKAQQVLEKLSVRNVVSWTALMAGYVNVGKSESAFVNFHKMLKEGVRPNLITFVVLLNACSHCGLLKRSQTYFEAMSKNFGVTPILAHHTCVVNLLGRVGQLTTAERMVEKLPVLPDMILWRVVLGACRNWGNLKFGERAFKHAML